MSKKKESKKSTRIALIVLAAIVFIILLVGCIIYFKLRHMSNSSVNIVPAPSTDIEPSTPSVTLVPVLDDNELDLSQDYEIDIDESEMGDDPIFEVNKKDKDVINILMLGSDSRGEDRGRTDSIMLASFNKRTGEAKLVSFLRDSWVYIPGKDTWNRINTAYFFGGIGMLINTLNYNFDLDVQYYMTVDFESLENITDKLGGIDIELTEKEIEYINNSCEDKLTVEAGWHHLNGEQTLIHARNRKIGNGDWSRAQRQRNVMMAFLNCAKQQKNATTLATLIYSLMDDVETNLSPVQLISLAIDVVLDGDINLNSRSIPFENTWQYAWEGKKAVIHIDIEKNKELINEYLYGN